MNGFAVSRYAQYHLDSWVYHVHQESNVPVTTHVLPDITEVTANDATTNSFLTPITDWPKDMFGRISSVMSSPLPAQPSSGLRMNQIQLVGSHNSYHREVNLTERRIFEVIVPEPENYYYSHANVSDQLGYQSVRSLEFDVWADPAGDLYTTPLIRKLTGGEMPTSPLMTKPGAKVFHILDLDVRTTCYTIVECLTQVREWSAANPHHVPIPILLEFKTPDTQQLQLFPNTRYADWNATNLDALDAEIRSVFSDSGMITPDDIRRDGLTLEQSILQHGWPTLEEARGKVFFVMDNEPTPGDIRNAYRSGGRENLQGRVIFTNSNPGEPDAAFLKRNDPIGENLASIQDLVAKGYWIRTRADEAIKDAVSGNTTKRESALESGAQIVSTDFPWRGMSARYDSDYVVNLPGASVARCNPVNAASTCGEDELEPGMP